MKHPNRQNKQAIIARDAASVSNRVATPVDEQAIRERAYSIYESNADATRSPETDWLEAEQQLRIDSPGPDGVAG